ncbi:unnamed protein product [Effrenium voratum]|uniref:Glycosyltransferase 2-like domain-containing protein n=1 Tax=Effrenium voratum TaxID=2562239 RepID=A0AA36HUQ7_9DINO|nr:unnamed protein product [Effrenium voratum]CAJ1425696.1 unnamed protein product [Effrenium voratum]
MAERGGAPEPSWWQRIWTTAPKGPVKLDEPNEFVIMRGNLFFLIFAFVLVPLPLWIDIFCPIFAAVYWLFVLWLGAFLLSVCAWHAVSAHCLMHQVADSMWEDQIPRGTEEERSLADRLQHLVMMCGYKEPMEVICQSVESLAAQTVAHRLVVVIGLEEGTPDVQEKAQRLKERYDLAFQRFHVMKHPKQWAKGVRGKCSNANYTMRAAVSRLEDYGELHLDCTTCTSCDSDSIFAPRYFENLGYQFLTSPKAKEVVWQAPVYYNHYLYERPFYVRDIGIMRTAYMLGFLIPFNINTMSIFSFSLDLCVKGEFFHAHYQMDDIHYTQTCMQALQKRVEIRMIPMPVISGPTSGSSHCKEYKEWFHQTKRWTIGACQVFHYLTKRRYGCGLALSYSACFVMYYGLILCSLTLTGLAGFINYALADVKHDTILNMAKEHTHQYPLSEELNRAVLMAGIFSLVWTYLIFAIFLYLDRKGIQLLYHLNMKPQGAEDTTFCQDFKDWILMWPSLVMYSFVSYLAIVKVALYGQKVCGHDPSSKEGLGSGQAMGELLSTSEVSGEGDSDEDEAEGYSRI